MKNITYPLLLFCLAVTFLKGESIEELFPPKLENSTGYPVLRDTLKGKIIGIYFSASWCPPCRGFTPKLVKFRDNNKSNFEVVLVSSDRGESAQRDYMASYNMKWAAVAHNSEDANKLKKKYMIRGIPSLVIVGPDGKTITKNGRTDVVDNPSGALASWEKVAGPLPSKDSHIDLSNLDAITKSLFPDPPKVDPIEVFDHSLPKYEWKNKDGKVIRASFVSATDKVVVIIMNGTTYTVDLDKLSKESRDLAEKLRESNNEDTSPTEI